MCCCIVVLVQNRYVAAANHFRSVLMLVLMGMVWHRLPPQPQQQHGR